MFTAKYQKTLLSLTLISILCFLADLSWGAVNVPLSDVFSALTGGQIKESWQYIILDYRLPKALTALLAGIGLAASGLLMQTLFRNPLAGPYVLGISSGASLGVAILVMGSVIIPGANYLAENSYTIVLAAWLGSFVVLICVLAIAGKLRDTFALLIVGLMFGSFTSAFVTVLSFFSTAEQLQKFTFWSLGNLGNLSWPSISLLAASILIGLAGSIYCLKPLDALLLGENYAASVGVQFKKVRLIIIISTSILAGTITAFVGPIAFVGLASPHLAKLLCNTGSHRIIFWASLLVGGILLIFCDLLSQIGGDLTFPINAVTSIVGAPIVIWLLVRKRTFS